MPTKCIDQMPVPITSEPAAHQVRETITSRVCTRLARSSAT